MTIDYDKLLNFDIPEVRQTYGARDVALYSLSVGLGQDPMDPRQIAFADGLKDDVRVMPAMANVLGHPGFWLSDPATGVDATKLLHGEQGMTLHAAGAAAEVKVAERAVDLVRGGRLVYTAAKHMQANPPLQPGAVVRLAGRTRR